MIYTLWTVQPHDYESEILNEPQLAVTFCEAILNVRTIKIGQTAGGGGDTLSQQLIKPRFITTKHNNHRAH